MWKCDFYCCCSEEMAENALPGKPLPCHHLLPSRGYRMMAGRLCPWGRAPKALSGCCKAVPTHLGEREGGMEEQAPSHVLGEPQPGCPGEGAEARWRGCAAQRHRLACPVPARLCTGREPRAENSPWHSDCHGEAIQTLRRGDKLNVVQLPVKPHAGRNDLWMFQWSSFWYKHSQGYLRAGLCSPRAPKQHFCLPTLRKTQNANSFSTD